MGQRMSRHTPQPPRPRARVCLDVRNVPPQALDRVRELRAAGELSAVELDCRRGYDEGVVGSVGEAAGGKVVLVL